MIAGMDISIRLVEKADLNAINEIYNQAVRSKYQTAETEETSLLYRQGWYEEHPCDFYPVYVAEVEGEVVGWVSLSEYRKDRKALRYTSEVSFYIREDRQGHGIGTALLAFIITRAREIGLKTLIAILLEPNKPSINLLKKFNFQIWGDMPKVAEFDGIECNHQFYGLRISDGAIRDPGLQVRG
jgi:phosphinothricin acetyltransferase